MVRIMLVQGGSNSGGSGKWIAFQGGSTCITQIESNWQYQSFNYLKKNFNNTPPPQLKKTLIFKDLLFNLHLINVGSWNEGRGKCSELFICHRSRTFKPAPAPQLCLQWYYIINRVIMLRTDLFPLNGVIEPECCHQALALYLGLARYRTYSICNFSCYRSMTLNRPWPFKTCT